MRLSDRYLLSEITIPACVGLVIVLMLLIGNQLYGILKYLYLHAASVHDILMALVYYIPGILMLAVPASLMLGVSLAINRFEREREMQALRMTGAPLWRLLMPVFLLGIGFSIGMFFFQDRIVPFTTHQAELIKRKLIFGSPTAFVQPDMVLKLPDNSFIYVRSMDPTGKKLYGVIMWKQNDGNYPDLYTVPKASYHNSKWIFEKDDAHPDAEATFYRFDKGGRLTSCGSAAGAELKIDKDAWTILSEQPNTADEYTLQQLSTMLGGIRGINNSLSMRGTGSGPTAVPMLDPRLITYYLHRKFANPLAALVAVLIAIPLSVHFGRSGGYIGLLLSMLVAFFFVVSQQWAQVLAETSNLNPIIAAWAPDGIFGGLGLILLLFEN